MSIIVEKCLTFNFDFNAIKFDNTDYYRKNFGIKLRNCNKKPSCCDLTQSCSCPVDEFGNKKGTCYKTMQNIPAVDILAVNGEAGYLIEIKDFRHPATQEKNLDELIEQFVRKVFSTLSAILPMKNGAINLTEKEIATSFTKTTHISVILHIELPPSSSPLTLASWDLSDIEMELKKRFKGCVIPKVVSKTSKNLSWIVT